MVPSFVGANERPGALFLRVEARAIKLVPTLATGAEGLKNAVGQAAPGAEYREEEYAYALSIQVGVKVVDALHDNC